MEENDNLVTHCRHKGTRSGVIHYCCCYYCNFSVAVEMEAGWMKIMWSVNISYFSFCRPILRQRKVQGKCPNTTFGDIIWRRANE